MLLSLGIAQAAQWPAIAETCRQDLAQRLKLPLERTQIESCQPHTFGDSSLALPRPGEMYLQVVTPGYNLQIKGRGHSYLYNATETGFRYGGPLDSWRYSTLYLEPVPNEPNLNGNLYQMSLAGTNPRLVVPQVSEFWPQANGAILAARRTSRSGFTLLQVAADGKVTNLGGALYYAQATLNADGTQWAAVMRPRLGAGWQMAWGPVQEGGGELKQVDLPAGSAPQRLYWGQERPIIVVKTLEGLRQFQLSANACGWEKSTTYLPAEEGETMLNKSESISIRPEKVDGRPSTVITFRWFNGSDKPVAVIPDFTVSHFTISPEQRFALINGRNSQDQAQAYTVDLASGEVLLSVPALQSAAKLYLLPPAAWLQFGPPATVQVQ
jgi:hypothetical protein